MDSDYIAYRLYSSFYHISLYLLLICFVILPTIAVVPLWRFSAILVRAIKCHDLLTYLLTYLLIRLS